ncbi:hypothetical protein QTP88_027089 [Uroleucon formosanum]
MGHSQRDCKVTSTIPATKGDTDDPITMIEINEQGNPPLMLNIDVECVGVKWTTDAIIDTGSPICIIKQSSVPSNVLVTPVSPKELNKITIKDRFPLPLIDDYLNMLKDKKFFTRLDLKNAFYHVKVKEDSIKYLSFVTHMDDILISTHIVDENFEILIEVFSIMSQNHLKLRLDKCSFLQEKIQCLGYEVSLNRIQPNPDNINAINNFPTPKNSKEVHSFLGLASYFRRLVKDFSITAKPLYDLIRKESEFNFGEEQLPAFKKLKTSLVSPPVLCLYSPSLETELHCDASQLGFDSVLVQKQNFDNKFHPIFYFSKHKDLMKELFLWET